MGNPTTPWTKLNQFRKRLRWVLNEPEIMAELSLDEQDWIRLLIERSYDLEKKFPKPENGEKVP